MGCRMRGDAVFGLCAARSEHNSECNRKLLVGVFWLFFYLFQRLFASWDVARVPHDRTSCEPKDEDEYLLTKMFRSTFKQHVSYSLRNLEPKQCSRTSLYLLVCFVGILSFARF